MCAGTCWAVNSSHEMFPFLHCHSKASSMSQPWMILLPQKKQICLICCTQLVSTSAETSLLWLDCPSGEDMKMLPSRTRRGENDKPLLSQKWAEKVESLAGFRPPLDGRSEAAGLQIVRGRGKRGLWRGADAVSRNTADILTGRWEERDGWKAAGQAGRWKVNHSHMWSVWLTSGLCRPPSPFPLLSLFTIRPPHGAASPFSVQPRLLCPSFFHPFLSILGSVWCFMNKTPCWGPFVPT